MQNLRQNRFIHRFRASGIKRTMAKLTFVGRGTTPNNTRGQKPTRTGALSRSQIVRLITRFGLVDFRNSVRFT